MMVMIKYHERGERKKVTAGKMKVKGHWVLCSVSSLSTKEEDRGSGLLRTTKKKKRNGEKKDGHV